uniref:hypothetical protein n=1 Tax=Pseudonocardia nigra TaxID=1921578 RepID=UPI001C5E1E35
MMVVAPRPGPALHDPALAAADRLTDRAELAALLDALPWLNGSDGARAAVRLRWKPGTNLRVGAVVPTAEGPAAVLVAAFAPEADSKADRLAARADRRGGHLYRA